VSYIGDTAIVWFGLLSELLIATL